MEFLSEYGMFLAKTLTLVAVTLVLVVVAAVLLARATGASGRERLDVKPLNQRYDNMAHALRAQMHGKRDLKRFAKAAKAKGKESRKGRRRRLYVLDFDGDIRASEVDTLREEVTAVLTVAEPDDEVFVRLDSSGGVVHSYGLAASQLKRIRDSGVHLTVSVDKIAASGGYMMACVAERVIAAPFAIIGSIGVVAQFPNFYRLMKKHDVDYEQFTAGEFKRTVTMFGENTEAARAKFMEDLEETHNLFKDFIASHRPALDMAKVSTGEYWHGSKALELGLVDDILTSDDYLLQQRDQADLFQVNFTRREPVGFKMPFFVRQSAPYWLPWPEQVRSSK